MKDFHKKKSKIKKLIELIDSNFSNRSTMKWKSLNFDSFYWTKTGNNTKPSWILNLKNKKISFNNENIESIFIENNVCIDSFEISLKEILLKEKELMELRVNKINKHVELTPIKNINIVQNKVKSIRDSD